MVRFSIKNRFNTSRMKIDKNSRRSQSQPKSKLSLEHKPQQKVNQLPKKLSHLNNNNPHHLKDRRINHLLECKPLQVNKHLRSTQRRHQPRKRPLLKSQINKENKKKLSNNNKFMNKNNYSSNKKRRKKKKDKSNNRFKLRIQINICQRMNWFMNQRYTRMSMNNQFNKL